MKIINLKLRNFQLFEELDLNFEKINLITGTNLDDLGASGNGSGKTTIINAILFALYGDVSGLTLKELIRIGEKNCSVNLTFLLNNEPYTIKREIPTSLTLYKDTEEIKFNTNTLTQKHIDNLLNTDINKFKMYHIIDQNKGINLLDLGVLSLRKQLMEFVDTYFSEIRNSLLSKKLERENYNIDKKLYTHYLSEKRKRILQLGLEELRNIRNDLNRSIKETNQGISNTKGEMAGKQKIINYKQSETKKAEEGICPILKQSCDKIGKKMSEKDKKKLSDEVELLYKEIEKLKESIKPEQEYLNNLEEQYKDIDLTIDRIKGRILRLINAFQFKDYKYTKKDVQLYADTIKVLDQFASYYVQEWLSNLSLIVNDLLQNVNISVEFSTDKNFIKVINNEQELNYAQLSSGQKTFLNTIFKIGILLNEGVNEGMLLIDEGINTLDNINLEKLLDILKELNFQSFIIYQNIDKDIKNVNFIELERKDGESKLL